jgi:hypothetical protein
LANLPRIIITDKKMLPILLLTLLLFTTTPHIIPLTNPTAVVAAESNTTAASNTGLRQIPSLNSDYPDNNPNSIKVKIFNDSKYVADYYRVKGEITNIGNKTLNSIKVTVHVFNSTNQQQPMGTAFSSIVPESLKPNHIGTFNATIDPAEMPGKPTSYRLSFDWK